MVRLMVAALLFMPVFAYAALIPTAQNFIIITATPEYPTPQAPITLTAKSTASAGIYAYRWIVDGKNIQEGVGVDSITLTAGEIGQSTTVEVSKIGPGGETLATATHIVHPADVDLVWEGDTTIPLLYKGKPLGNETSTYKIKAIPFLTSSKADNESGLMFEWEIDGKLKSALSGYGKSLASVTAPFFLRAFTVSVTVSTPNGAIAAQKSVVITPTKPTVVVYEEHPLLGTLLNHAMLGETHLNETEATLRAFPLFIEKSDTPVFTWLLNKKEIRLDTDTTNVATFRKTGTGQGAYPIGVRVTSEHTNNAEWFFNLQF